MNGNGRDPSRGAAEAPGPGDAPVLDVFAFREELVAEYGRFARSFSEIRAKDISDKVDDAYESGRFWPAPLIQLNPNFEAGGAIDELVANDTLHPECAKIFRLKRPDHARGDRLILHRHQKDAIDIARRRESYVLTTGTGSGKSLAYFIPIVDDVLRRRQAGETCKRISAIVVYPMNALCNSQREELEKYLRLGYAEGGEPVTFARYTGQESNEERERIAKNPPDILLTNYVMLELIMTRFLETDKAVRKHAAGLRFLVLDELHTYRGRQGADVAMLIRRVRERLNQDLLCVGTSATMASEGSPEDRDRAVADVATRLFGAVVPASNVVSETLRPVTDFSRPITKDQLRAAIEAGAPENPTHEDFLAHPVAAWVERTLGLEESQSGKLMRISSPRDINRASAELSEASGVDLSACHSYLRRFLLAAHQSLDARKKSFFAFRLHQFIGGAWDAYATLEAPDERYVTLDGQQFKPQDRDRPLFRLAFCRKCGQEYFPVWADAQGKTLKAFRPRNLSERSTNDERLQYGYLVPDADGEFDLSDDSRYPEPWLDFRGDKPKLKPYYRKYRPLQVRVDTLGQVKDDSGLRAWFISGPFRFCLRPDCDAFYPGSMRSEFVKLSGLSSEGRSSATTVLAFYALKHLIGTDLDDATKKLLGFLDNRQDASLQAGHFNDFIQVLQLRGALLSAMRAYGPLDEEYLAQRVFSRLRLRPEDYASSPGTKGIKKQRTLRVMRDVLGYRLYFDLQRGWRITQPNLEQLNLLKVGYKGLMDCCEDEEEWDARHPVLASATPETRFSFASELLDRMRKALCIKTTYLRPSFQERLSTRSDAELKEPWGLPEEERLFSHAFMIPRPAPRGRRRTHQVINVSHRSAFGRKTTSRAFWETDNPDVPAPFNEAAYNQVVDDVLGVLEVYGHVEASELDSGRIGYQVVGSALEWRLAEAEDGQTERVNPFFRDLYRNVAAMLGDDDRLLHQLEAREHTAQVDADAREEREEQFRRGLAPPPPGEKSGLPVLFCSPTMELGVDIATLNTVYMRNVPPSPSNYAQRSGRAGRSGQPALVVTYCAARSPHDQYFFSKPARMVAGAVSPPNIDLANEELIRSHLQSVWLAETGVMLGSTVRDVLYLEDAESLPLQDDIAVQVNAQSVRKKARARAHRILDGMKSELTEQHAPWFTDSWRDAAMSAAPRRFDKAFDRWRSLYRATRRQRAEANKILDHAAATEERRSRARSSFNEAAKQEGLLRGDSKTLNSDFNTYRYLAAQGFLPGYNFPRLPLMAFVPGRRKKLPRDSFLSRPRFLGLSEFGPQSLIYHEGSTYRVRRVIFSVREESEIGVSAKLPVRAARICPECGYAHFGEKADLERCENCGARMDGGRAIMNLYRIEQVSAQRAHRITSDEEERQRQGYEMITTLRFSEEEGSPRVQGISWKEGDETLLEMGYGPAATVWRINLGWRRRKEQSIFGFSVDTNNGEWAKDPQAPTDAEDDAVREGKSVQRITPFVQDTRNVLLLQPKLELDTQAIVSLQYAIKRGIEQEFQLEEAELAAEPLPDRNNRAMILFYESAEGGAGVLTRLVNDPEALGRVCRRALEICHFRSRSGDWSGFGDLQDTKENCEAGCYLCLLSYFNQPDHPLIDRQNEAMLELLCRLGRAKPHGLGGLRSCDHFEMLWRVSTSSLEREWLKFIKFNGFRLPDDAQRYLEKYRTRPDFEYKDAQTLVFVDGPIHLSEEKQEKDKEIDRCLADAGYTVIRFPHLTPTWPGIARDYSWVFGPGARSECGE